MYLRWLVIPEICHTGGKCNPFHFLYFTFHVKMHRKIKKMPIKSQDFDNVKRMQPSNERTFEKSNCKDARKGLEKVGVFNTVLFCSVTSLWHASQQQPGSSYSNSNPEKHLRSNTTLIHVSIWWLTLKRWLHYIYVKVCYNVKLLINRGTV